MVSYSMYSFEGGLAFKLLQFTYAVAWMGRSAANRYPCLNFSGNFSSNP